MTTAAMKLALEAAYLAGFNASGEGYNGEYGIDCPEENAIWKKDRDNALREALAEQPAQQPAQQEPVAGVVLREGLPTLLQDRNIKSTDQRLYTSPPAQRKPLTDEQIEALAKQHFAKDERSFKSCARAIEAAHGITKE